MKGKIAGLGCFGIGLIALVVIGGILAFYGMGWYNTVIEAQEGVDAQWANVESSYQRRADLIPNIVSTAQEYAEFEQETLKMVVEARAKATSIQLDASNLTAEHVELFTKAQNSLSTGLGRLLATFERYPDLKANENFKELINNLERTENRINRERNLFNEEVKRYNLKVKKFPGLLIADFFGFDELPYFQADEGTDVAPDVGDLFDN